MLNGAIDGVIDDEGKTSATLVAIQALAEARPTTIYWPTIRTRRNGSTASDEFAPDGSHNGRDRSKTCLLESFSRLRGALVDVVHHPSLWHRSRRCRLVRPANGMIELGAWR
jgi:hypothetical protein